MFKSFIAAVALIASPVAAHAADHWWMTSAGPQSGNKFVACEAAGDSAHPAEDMAVWSKQNMSLAYDPKFNRFSVKGAEVAFVGDFLVNGNVNVFGFATTKKACEAIRAGKIDSGHWHPYTEADMPREECPPGVITANCVIRPKPGTHQCPAGYRWVEEMKACNGD